jgi:DNA-binding NarL/FixJ family response regulator
MKLYPREKQIAEPVARGLSNKQVAEMLGLSPKSISAQMRMTSHSK